MFNTRSSVSKELATIIYITSIYVHCFSIWSKVASGTHAYFFPLNLFNGGLMSQAKNSFN